MKKFFNIILLSFIVIVLWIIFSIYNISHSSHPIISVPQQLLSNFNGNLYQTTFEDIVNRQQYICVNSDFLPKNNCKVILVTK